MVEKRLSLRSSCDSSRQKHYLLQVCVPIILLILTMQVSGYSTHSEVGLNDNPFAEELILSSSDTIPLKERKGNFLLNRGKNPFDLKDPSIIDQNVEYDPVTDRYIITEKMGDEYYRAPTYMTFEEYLDWKSKQQEKSYFDALAGVGDNDRASTKKKDPLAPFKIKKTLVDRLFGSNSIEIKPQGNVDITFKGSYFINENPLLPSYRQSYPQFDFQQDVRMSVTGKIGSKLNLDANFNTGRGQFDFNKIFKLAYDGAAFSEDDIIQNIEAGNVSLPLKSSLIQGSQSLFGLKTELKFGHLNITALASQQRSKQGRIKIESGTIEQTFEVRPDQYDENRHFFLSFYHRNSYERSLENLPEVTSLVQIKSIEVWITDNNSSNIRPEFRDIVGLADLGTSDYTRFHHDNPDFLKNTSPPRSDLYGVPLPYNQANKIFELVTRDTSKRKRSSVVNFLQSDLNMIQTKDFEKVRARKLSSSEFTYNPQLGFISLNVRPKPDQIVAVSYEYSYRGKIYRVGEFANDIPSDSSYNVIYTKMLKSSTQNVNQPSWDLMMKNVYPLGTYGLTNEDFRLDIYYESLDGIPRRYIEELKGYPLVNLFKLDNLNATGDPQPDGTFDYVPGLTILPRIGSIIFPVLEPFGSSFAKLIEPIEPDSIKRKIMTDKYVFQSLYDTTITAARERLEKNKFFLKGKYKSSTSSEISLGAFNIPRGSVRVTAGGKVLSEANGDISIDYNIGRVRILNDQYLQPGIPIDISFEDNTAFGFQIKTMIGLRADYSIGKDINIGGTYLHLFEQPYTTKVNIGDDPINNRIFGADFNISKETPWLTRLVDNIPLIDTKEKSQITLQAEAAAIKPGHSRAIEQKSSNGGVIYIDDFEGASSPILLTYPVIKWTMASIPQGLKNRFQESKLTNDLASGANRAKIAWYSIEFGTSSSSDLNSSYTRSIAQEELFPNKTRLNTYAIANQRIFDITYFPNERGPYNFDLPAPGYPTSSGVDKDNKLLNPGSRWAGIMRDLTTNDFEEANVEYVDFWMMNPYMDKEDGSPISQEGVMEIHLGTLSEDIFKDSRQQYENGLPTQDQNLPTENTAWGRIARRPPLVSNSFDNNRREEQDVGYDGLNDNLETQFFSDYIETMRGYLNPRVLNDEVLVDPANDNFKHFLDPDFSDQDNSIIRYKNFNNPHGNAQSSRASFSGAVRSYTNYPDKEDLNEDESLNESENYYVYKIPMYRIGKELDIARMPQVTDQRVTERGGEKWYRFRIPIRSYDTIAGQIQNFRSIQFMRMVFTEFNERTTFRFAKLELTRNQWRRYSQDRCGKGSDAVLSPEDFNMDVVNIEENDSRFPFKYALPRGIARERIQGAYADQFQNEQSLSLTIENLQDSCERSIYKLINLDINNFERIKMFVHAHELDAMVSPIEDGDLTVFMQIGKDFEDNYYEYEIPLNISHPENGTDNSENIWLKDNEFDFALSLFTNLKIERNTAGFPVNKLFMKGDPEKGENTIKIVGNPTFGLVKGIRIGVRNSKKVENNNANVEVWINELRMTGLNERGGVAALARLDIQLADFGTFTAAGAYTGIGFGGLDQKLAQRSQEEIIQYDLSTNLKLDKFFPKKWKVSLPFYAQYTNSKSVPLYDPVDTDLKLRTKINNAKTTVKKDSIRSQAIDQVQVKAFNFTNVRKESKKKKGIPMPWAISNFSASYAYSDVTKSDPILEKDQINTQTASLDYDYTIKAPYIKPFYKLVKAKPLKFIKEINFNPIPNSFNFTSSFDRQRSTRTFRFADPEFSTWQSNRFNWDRDYNLKWDMMKSLKFNLNATNLGIVDEILYNPLRRGFVNPVTNEVVNQSEKQPFLSNNIKNFGRTKEYSHKMNVAYTVPLRNISLLNWVTAKASYTANYKWTSGSLRTIQDLGSFIQNGQDVQLTLDLNFRKIYNKSSYLKTIYQRPRPTRGKKSRSRSKTITPKKTNRKDRKSKKRSVSMGERIAIRPLLLLRNAKFTYSENRQTVVPGFMQSPSVLGMGDNFTSPGWDFIAGIQPRLGTNNDPGWLDEIGQKGWLSTSVFLAQEVLQIRNRKANAKITLEPFYDFKVDINIDWNKTFQLSEQFVDTLDNGQNDLRHLTPYETGSYKISFISLQTLFGKNDTLSGLFSKMEQYRPRLSQRVAAKYNITAPHEISELAQKGYKDGFGPNHNEVLMPAFVAAYTNQTPDQVGLNLFDIMPLPNWQLTYNGLSKIGIFRDVFKNFSLKHGYKSTMTINSFNTNYQYAENLDGQPDNRIQQTKSFYPRYRIPAVVISEAFSPLLGIKFETDNSLSFSVEMKKSRDLSLELDHGKLNETLSTDYVLGLGYVIQNFDFKTFGRTGNKKKKKKKKKKTKTAQKTALQSLFGGKDTPEGRSLEMNFEFSYKDNLSQAYSLNERGIVEAFRGSTEISILPALNYLYSDRLSFRLFFEYRKSIPHVSRQFGRTTYDSGLTVRFTLK